MRVHKNVLIEAIFAGKEKMIQDHMRVRLRCAARVFYFDASPAGESVPTVFLCGHVDRAILSWQVARVRRSWRRAWMIDHVQDHRRDGDGRRTSPARDPAGRLRGRALG